MHAQTRVGRDDLAKCSRRVAGHEQWDICCGGADGTLRSPPPSSHPGRQTGTSCRTVCSRGCGARLGRGAWATGKFANVTSRHDDQKSTQHRGTPSRSHRPWRNVAGGTNWSSTNRRNSEAIHTSSSVSPNRPVSRTAQRPSSILVPGALIKIIPTIRSPFRGRPKSDRLPVGPAIAFIPES
jgi:hypothetical protein